MEYDLILSMIFGMNIHHSFSRLQRHFDGHDMAYPSSLQTAVVVAGVLLAPLPHSIGCLSPSAMF